MNTSYFKGYPTEKCLVWLAKIREKYSQLEDEPLYWECRAAIDREKGNINGAIESYQTAIVKGSDVATVDKCLDDLLQKFDMLKIDSARATGAKRRNQLDEKQIFKSTIIEFAVRERHK